ncbi:hypothetical protein QTN25_005358 [Entamoeba marina]
MKTTPDMKKEYFDIKKQIEKINSSTKCNDQKKFIIILESNSNNKDSIICDKKVVYDIKGYDKEGLNNNGYDINGIHYTVFSGRRNIILNRQFGFAGSNFDKNGYDKNGYDRKGYNENGYYFYERDGFNREQSRN